MLMMNFNTDTGRPSQHKTKAKPKRRNKPTRQKSEVPIISGIPLGIQQNAFMPDLDQEMLDIEPQHHHHQQQHQNFNYTTSPNEPLIHQQTISNPYQQETTKKQAMPQHHQHQQQHGHMYHPQQILNAYQLQTHKSEDEMNEIYSMINDLPKLSPGSEFSFSSVHDDLRMNIDKNERGSITLENLLEDDPLFSFTNALERQESNETILQGSSPINADNFEDDEVLRQSALHGNHNQSVEQLKRLSQISTSTNGSEYVGPNLKSSFYNISDNSNSALELVVPSSLSSLSSKHRQSSITQSIPAYQPLIFPPQQQLFRIIQPPPPPSEPFPLVLTPAHRINSQKSHSTLSVRSGGSTETATSSDPKAKWEDIIPQTSIPIVPPPSAKPNRAPQPQQRYSSLIIESPTATNHPTPNKLNKKSLSSSSTPQSRGSISKTGSSTKLSKIQKLPACNSTANLSTISTSLSSGYANVKKSKSFQSKSYLHNTSNTLSRNPDSFYQTLDFSKSISGWNNRTNSDRVSAYGSNLKSKFPLDLSTTKSYEFVIEDGQKGYNDRSAALLRRKASASSLPATASFSGFSNITPTSFKSRYANNNSSTHTVSNVPSYTAGQYQPNRHPNRSSSSSLNSDISNSQSPPPNTVNANTTTTSARTKPRSDPRQTPQYKYQSIIYPTPNPPNQIHMYHGPTPPHSQGAAYKGRDSQSSGAGGISQSPYDSPPNTSHSPASSIRVKRKNSDSSSLSTASSRWSEMN